MEFCLHKKQEKKEECSKNFLHPKKVTENILIKRSHHFVKKKKILIVINETDVSSCKTLGQMPALYTTHINSLKSSNQQFARSFIKINWNEPETTITQTTIITKKQIISAHLSFFKYFIIKIKKQKKNNSIEKESSKF